MVYKCFVTGCKSHKIPQNTTFGIPKDPDLRRSWEEALRPYSKGKVLQDKHRVCKAHFNPEEMEFYFVHLIQGTEVKIERGRPELKKGAIPSVFPGARKSAWQRVLDRQRAEEEKTKQSILLRNGEWVHVKEPENPIKPPTKSKKSIKPTSSIAAANNNSDSRDSTKQNSFSENLDEASEYVCLLPGGNTNVTGSKELPGNHGSVLQSAQGYLPVKPPDKDISSICINWDALPLPEELGALLCDTSVAPLSSSSDFNVHASISHAPSQRLLPKPVLANLQPPMRLQENSPSEQPPDENLSIPDNIADEEQDEEESVPLTFQGLLSGVSNVPMPSSMWASHTDHMSVFFSFMSYGSTGYLAVPKVEKIVMYQGSILPRVFLRGMEVNLPVSEEKSRSLEDVEKVLCYIDKLKLCLGIDCAGDIVSYAPECDIFVESGRLPRCQSCKKQKTLEYNRKRHLENDDSKSRFSPPKKKKKKKVKSSHLSERFRRPN